MCGIFGYVGKKNGVTVAISGLKKIEYRGYDSAGLAFVTDEHAIQCHRAVGKLSNLAKKEVDTISGRCVIAHTRWATHGSVSIENTHPIIDETGSVAVVHNGIVENYSYLKNQLIHEGVTFSTETDTEVLCHLIARAYKGNLLSAVQTTLKIVKGAWAVAVIHKDNPNECVVATQSCPLVLGIGKGEMFFASDPNALLSYTKEVVYLEDGQVAHLTADNVTLFNESHQTISTKVEYLLHTTEDVSKGHFEHFTLKEIFEQPTSIYNALASRIEIDNATAFFGDAFLKPSDLLRVQRIVIVACGTSWHAALIGSYMLQELAHIPTSVEISSEYRYKNLLIENDTLAIAISQSGETADTIAAVREIKRKGARVVGICNVHGSTLTRESDATLFLHAGPEIGVCSTKAFTSQLVVLSLFAIMMARLKYMSKSDGMKLLHALQEIPRQVQEILAMHNEIRIIAEKYAHFHDFFFLGRRYMYPTCLEGALKLKEIAYINANGYAAGEIKHGPIALLGRRCPIFALCADSVTYDKTVSNIMEAKARISPVIAVTDRVDESLQSVVDDCIVIPKTYDEFSPILSTVVSQLFSYYCAAIRGADIDQPKNLAKSVTVE